MKKVWLSIGAAVIVVLLLLQTRFRVFMVMGESGYAVCDKSMKQTLMQDPAEIEGQPVFSHYRFETLDRIFTRGGSYYMGEKKKREIDLGFPLYTSGGAGIYFTGDTGTLFDVDFSEAAVYQGLSVNDRISYNPGGDRADATEYLFCGLNNGLFMNFSPILYEDKGETRQIDRNSVIHFSENFFSYIEQSEENSGEGRYQACRNVSDAMEITVNGESLTYRELLLRLHVITEKKDRQRGTKTPEETDEEMTELPENEAAEEMQNEAVTAEEDAAAQKESGEKRDKQLQENKNRGEDAAPAEKPENAQKKPQKEQKPPGERPDNMRPDKQPPKKELVQGYVKPTVKVESVTAGVYRIMLDVRVNDPAGRLHDREKVRFEFYEVGADGSEKLVYRTFTGGSNKELTAGDGNIKPDTTYRINAYFTYYDEYGSVVVESIPLDQLITDSRIRTKVLDSLGEVDLASPQPEYYYDHYLELPKVRYADHSDPEAVYGINRNAGMRITVEGVSNAGFKAVTYPDANTIRSFKNHMVTIFQSAAGLEAKSSYRFTIEAEDYFGNPIKLVNNTGNFETCKARPAGTLEITANKLGDFRMRVKMADEDASAIEREGGSGYDIYLVYSTERAEISAVTKEECEAYIAEGKPVPGSKVAFAYKFSADEYMKDGKLAIDKIVQTNNLDLDTRYFAYLYCDYDLNNRRGPVRLGEIAYQSFTSASLSSLGNIYIRTDISNITSSSADITYMMNTDRTLDELERLLYTIRFDIVRAGGEEEVKDSYIAFDVNAVTLFTGYDHGTNETPVEYPWEKGAEAGLIRMGSDYFDGTLSEEQHALQSMTEYRIVPYVTALYNGKEYEMKVSLTNSTFKTMKKPATVTVEDLVLAGNTLRLKTKVEDPDGAIIGNNSQVAMLTVYQTDVSVDATPVKVLRITKNTDLQEIVVRNLDPTKNYRLVFRAEEYNEGYTNATYVPNKVLEDVLLKESVKLMGSLKLLEIAEAGGDLTANVRVEISDIEKMLSEDFFYIKVEKDGADVSERYPEGYPVKETDYQEEKLSYRKPFSVDKGEYTYLLTLYAKVNGYDLPLDTLTFTTEQEVIGINSEGDFIYKVRNNPTKKFVVTTDLTLDSETYYKNPENPSQQMRPKQFVELFEGAIDFQGYTLDYKVHSLDSNLIKNVGGRGDISNFTLNAYLESEARLYSDGVLCGDNYGRIHDFVAVCKSFTDMEHETYYFGLICDGNAVSGIIENFAVANAPEEGDTPIRLAYYSGLICDNNRGIIRNGYAYGQNIETDIAAPPEKGSSLTVGAITGINHPAGRIYNVYSLVNVTVAGVHRSKDQKTYPSKYGNVVGENKGYLANAYGIGRSHSTNEDGNEIYTAKTGAVYGVNSGRVSGLYYWNDADMDYDANYNTRRRVSLESLYDSGWQASVLGGQFDTTPVGVGFYPHVLMSDEMPEQPYIPLPDTKGSSDLIKLISADLVEYVDDGKAAIVEFRFENKSNTVIEEVSVEGLDVVIDGDSAESVGGYTTVRGRVSVSDGGKYVSAYDITGASFRHLGLSRSVTFNPKPQLMVDFYRDVSTADEWYDYVVMKPAENARLRSDIDFSGVAENRIMVASDYTGKLDGGKSGDQAAGYCLKNISILSGRESTRTVFSTVKGEIKNLCVEGLTLGTESNPGNSSGFINNIQSGTVENVHLLDVKIAGHTNVGGLAATGQYAEIKNCSVSKIDIVYREPANTNTTGQVGGLAGKLEYSGVTSSYVRNLTMTAEDMQDCTGAGGLVGYLMQSFVENVYTTGSMTVRGNRVGGVVGYLENTHAREVYVKNVLSKVNVFCYQNKLGGIIGELKQNGVVNSQMNFTGAAFGNVFSNNPDVKGVSLTVGTVSGSKLWMFGSEVQLMNGIRASQSTKDANTRGVLSREEMKDPSVFIDKVEMTRGVYDYSTVADGNMPVLYYAGTRTELPFQEERISLGLFSDDEISVKDVSFNKDLRQITLDLNTPKGTEYNYKVTNVTIEDLLLGEKRKNENVIHASEQGDATNRTVVNYLPEISSLGKDTHQEHWKDSYMLVGIEYTKTDRDGNVLETKAYVDFSNDPVRIPLTLFADIWNISDWNTYISVENNYGAYENYKIKDSIDFGSSTGYTRNAKLGRLIGDDSTPEGDLDQAGNMATLRNISLTGSMTGNLIYRLNAEMSNIRFENCTINQAGRSCTGIVGTSAGTIRSMIFHHITVDGESQIRAGIVGYQISGELKDIELTDITVKGAADHRGGLCATSVGMTYYRNITGSDINIFGKNYLGGLLGNTDSSAYEDIAFSKVVVSGTNANIGGIVGRHSTNNGSAHMWNVSITGTPTKDADGRVTISDSKVSSSYNSTNNVYVGGIAGYMNNVNVGTGRSSGRNDLLVDGIVVEAGGVMIGGAFGQFEQTSNSVTVNDVYMKINVISSGYSSYIGGIAGRAATNTGCAVNNLNIEGTNIAWTGLAYGNANNTTNCVVKESLVTVSIDETKKAGEWSYPCIGGLAGELNGVAKGCAVINSSIKVNQSATRTNGNVGGLVGQMQNSSSLQNCFYYAEPAAGKASADSQYVVEGSSTVGGLVGAVQSSNAKVEYCYSNANVKALCSENGSGGLRAGGLVGNYANNYKVSTSAGKTIYTYSKVFLHDCYFAGTVYAQSKYAGGAVGQNGMATSTDVQSAHKESGGRRMVAEGGATVKSGEQDEWYYTYYNLILAESVYAGDKSTAHAFSGTQDGFEGMPNAYNAGDGVPDKTKEDRASRTYFFSGMRIGSEDDNERLCDIINAETDSALQSSGTYRYKLWNKNEYPTYFTGNEETTYYPYNSARVNVRLVGTDDLKGESQAQVLRSLAWIQNNKANDTSMKAPNYRMIYDGAGTDEEWTEWRNENTEYVTEYRWKDYLPHVRVTTGTAVLDYQTRRQCAEGIRLPIPEDGPTSRASRMSLRRTEETYGIAYPVAADKINLEFSADLVEAGGYFTLRYGNELVARERITKRVYTYAYDYGKNLKLAYGFTETDEEETEAAESDTQAGGTSAASGLDENWAAAEPIETISYKAADLARHIMVYGNEYYYISGDGIVHGNGSGSAEDDSGKVKDADAEILPGSYLSLYNGRALAKDGSVVNVKTGETLYQVKGIEQAEGSAIPLQRIRYGGTMMETYAKHSKVIGSDTERSAQVLQGYTGVTGVIDGALENRKDAVLLYEKGGNEYQTILGTDGIMVDLYQGDDLNAPEDFRRSGIVSMTNNLNCNVPFVLVEYQNGSIVGYNYMTGEYLFDNYVRDTLGLVDYVKSLFTGDKSMYENANSAYADNKKLADIAGTPERLEKIVRGNSSGSDIEGNSTGSGVQIEHAAEGKTNADGEKAVGETEAAAGSGMEEGTAKEAGVKSGTVGGEEAGADGAAYGEGTDAGDIAGAGEEAAAGDIAAAGDKAGAGEEAAAGDESGSGSEIGADEAIDAEDAKAGTKVEADEASEADDAEDGTKIEADKELEADDAEDGSKSGAGKESGADGAKEETEETESAETEAVADAGQGGRLITVYNQSTGTYELVDIEQYFNEPVYYSENHKLNVQDLRAYAGFAAQKEETKSADGLMLYILVAMAVLGGVGIILRYRKVKNVK